MPMPRLDSVFNPLQANVAIENPDINSLLLALKGAGESFNTLGEGATERAASNTFMDRLTGKIGDKELAARLGSSGGVDTLLKNNLLKAQADYYNNGKNSGKSTLGSSIAQANLQRNLDKDTLEKDVSAFDAKLMNYIQANPNVTPDQLIKLALDGKVDPQVLAGSKLGKYAEQRLNSFGSKLGSNQGELAGYDTQGLSPEVLRPTTATPNGGRIPTDKLKGLPDTLEKQVRFFGADPEVAKEMGLGPKKHFWPWENDQPGALGEESLKDLTPNERANFNVFGQIANRISDPTLAIKLFKKWNSELSPHKGTWLVGKDNNDAELNRRATEFLALDTKEQNRLLQKYFGQ